MKYTFKSPLRYPGGKSKMTSKLTALLPANLPALVSPFVGGGSAILYPRPEADCLQAAKSSRLAAEPRSMSPFSRSARFQHRL